MISKDTEDFEEIEEYEEEKDTYIVDDNKKDRVEFTFNSSSPLLSVISANSQQVITHTKKILSLQNADECPVFRCPCLGPACTAYEITKEISYYDKDKKQWIGLSVLLEMKLPQNQRSVQKHVVIIHGCRYQIEDDNVKVLLRQTFKDFNVPMSIEDSI